MADKIFAVLSLVLLIGFTGILAVYVNEPDLWVVVVIALLMAGYDFWRSLRSGKDRPNS